MLVETVRRARTVRRWRGRWRWWRRRRWLLGCGGYSGGGSYGGSYGGGGGGEFNPGAPGVLRGSSHRPSTPSAGSPRQSSRWTKARKPDRTPPRWTPPSIAAFQAADEPRLRSRRRSSARLAASTHPAAWSARTLSSPARSCPTARHPRFAQFRMMQLLRQRDELEPDRHLSSRRRARGRRVQCARTWRPRVLHDGVRVEPRPLASTKRATASSPSTGASPAKQRFRRRRRVQRRPESVHAPLPNDDMGESDYRHLLPRAREQRRSTGCSPRSPGQVATTSRPDRAALVTPDLAPVEH